MNNIGTPCPKSFINVNNGYKQETLDYNPVEETGLLAVPNGAELLVLWAHGDYVFYKDSQGYFPGDAEWDWRHSSENVQTLRAGAHQNARIVWDVENEPS